MNLELDDEARLVVEAALDNEWRRLDGRIDRDLDADPKFDESWAYQNRRRRQGILDRLLVELRT